MEFNDIMQRIIKSKDPSQKQAIISFTRYLKTYPLDQTTFPIFQEILKQNYDEISEILFENRTPETFFSTLPVSKEIIVTTLGILVTFKPLVLNPKIVLACLGVIENAYKHAPSGFGKYSLTISDLQHIGKYLITKNEKIVEFVKNILEPVSSFSGNSEVSIFAQKIIDNYNDHKKRLENVIPETLLK
jgi:hypothetical protein